MSPRGQQNSHQQPHRFIKEEPTVVRSFIYSLPSPLSQYLEGCFNSSGFRTGSCTTFYHFPILQQKLLLPVPSSHPKGLLIIYFKGYMFINHKNYPRHLVSEKKKLLLLNLRLPQAFLSQ